MRTLTFKCHNIRAQVKIHILYGPLRKPAGETSESTPRDSSGLKYYAVGGPGKLSHLSGIDHPGMRGPSLEPYGSWRQMELPSLSSHPGESQMCVECMSDPTVILNAERLTGLKL